MGETTTKLTGAEAITAFTEARKPDHGVKVWRYHHVQCAGGETSWGGETWVEELLRPREDLDGYVNGTWEEAEWDGATLELSNSGGHRYSLWYEEADARPRVAYLGAHCGFEWEDQSAESDALRTLLRQIAWDDADLAEFGLASAEDSEYGDDGGFWVAADADKFRAVAEKCRTLSEEFDDLDADDVLAFLRDGTRPETGNND